MEKIEFPVNPKDVWSCTKQKPPIPVIAVIKAAQDS
jgi:hypothetical protein